MAHLGPGRAPLPCALLYAARSAEGSAPDPRRAFGEVLEAVRGDAARVVAVTSPDKAAAVNEQSPGFWNITKVL